MRVDARLLFAVVAAAAALAFAACGSPDGPTREFVFTPVPYTVVAPEGCDPAICGDAMSLDENAGRYWSDRVTVFAHPQNRAALMKWLRMYGFPVLGEETSTDQGARDRFGTMFLVGVPPGAARAVSERLAAEVPVISAEPSGTFELQ